MSTWLGRLGAALALGVLTGFIVWFLGAVTIALARVLPIWIMWAIAGGVFVGTVVIDTALDAYRSQRVRDRYEIARRAALGRDDDEL